MVSAVMAAMNDTIIKKAYSVTYRSLDFLESTSSNVVFRIIEESIGETSSASVEDVKTRSSRKSASLPRSTLISQSFVCFNPLFPLSHNYVIKHTRRMISFHHD